LLQWQENSIQRAAMDILLLQLFWWSFALIGAAVLIGGAQKRIRQLLALAHLAKLSVFSALFICLSIGIIVFSPLIITAYIFEFSVGLVLLVYLVVLAASLLFLIKYSVWIANALRKSFFTDRNNKLIVVIILLSLLFDYILALHFHGTVGQSDAAVHIARINFIANGHFGLGDPYIANHGIVDPRYSANLMLGLQAVAAKLLQLPAVAVWHYSYAFYRAYMWLALFFMTFTLVGKDQRRRWSYALLAVMPMLIGGYFILVEFPDRIVLAGVALLLAGTKLWLEGETWLPMVAGAIFIGAAHAINAAMALSFLLITAVALLSFKKLPFRRLMPLLVSLCTLALPVILNMYYPNHIPDSKLAFEASSIAGTPFIIHKYGWLHLGPLPKLDMLTTVAYGIVSALLLAATKLHDTPRLKKLAYVFAAIIALLAYKPLLISLFGYYFIVRSNKRTETKVMLYVLVSFYAMFAYNPIFLAAFGSTIPPWLIARFQEFNLLGRVAPFIAFIALAELAMKASWVQKKRFLPYACAILLFFILAPVFQFELPYAGIVSAERMGHNLREPQLGQLTVFHKELEGQIVYSNNLEADWLIPALITNSHVIYTHITNYAPMSDGVRRNRCAESLHTRLSQQDLASAGITKVLAYKIDDDRFVQLADSKPYLIPVNDKGPYRLYEVRRLKSAQPTGICALPQGE
jgi:hypothetical protein